MFHPKLIWLGQMSFPKLLRGSPKENVIEKVKNAVTPCRTLKVLRTSLVALIEDKICALFGITA
jgi:hypothetical protein